MSWAWTSPWVCRASRLRASGSWAGERSDTHSRMPPARPEPADRSPRGRRMLRQEGVDAPPPPPAARAAIAVPATPRVSAAATRPPRAAERGRRADRDARDIAHVGAIERLAPRRIGVRLSGRVAERMLELVLDGRGLRQQAECERSKPWLCRSSIASSSASGCRTPPPPRGSPSLASCRPAFLGSRARPARCRHGRATSWAPAGRSGVPENAPPHRGGGFDMIHDWFAALGAGGGSARARSSCASAPQSC